MKPNVTLMVFIQLPDLGACLSQEGNNANNVKGNASASAKPNIPIAGAVMLLVVLTCTKRKPIIGPVQEKLTNERVKAMRKIDINPLVLLALLSTEFAHFSGSFISNQPKKDSAKTTKRAQNTILNTAFVARSFNLLAPNIDVITKPNVT